MSFLPDSQVNPDAFFSARGARVLDYLASVKTYVVELPENADVLAVMSDIAGAPGVKFVEQDQVRYLQPVIEPAPSSPVLSATSTTLGVVFMLSLVAWALRSL